MENKTWKIIAIVFIILFTLETAYFIWAVTSTLQLEQETNECYYDICAEYPDAYYVGGICTCYELDSNNEYTVAKTELIK